MCSMPPSALLSGREQPGACSGDPRARASQLGGWADEGVGPTCPTDTALRSSSSLPSAHRPRRHFPPGRERLVGGGEPLLQPPASPRPPISAPEQQPKKPFPVTGSVQARAMPDLKRRPDHGDKPRRRRTRGSSKGPPSPCPRRRRTAGSDDCPIPASPVLPSPVLTPAESSLLPPFPFFPEIANRYSSSYCPLRKTACRRQPSWTNLPSDSSGSPAGCSRTPTEPCG